MLTVKWSAITVSYTHLDVYKRQRTAGVAVTSVNGLPGGTVNVRVRGTTSLNTSNDPLYVIDGIMSGGLDVNPADIQSIEVLKDASATAIYGSRLSLIHIFYFIKE